MAKEEAMALHSEAVKSADEALYQAGFSDGVASVPASPDVQAQIDSAVAAKAAEDQIKIDAVQAELDQAKSDDEADKAAIAAKQEIIDKIKALLG